jgi:hypothetical protein
LLPSDRFSALQVSLITLTADLHTIPTGEMVKHWFF